MKNLLNIIKIQSVLKHENLQNIFYRRNNEYNIHKAFLNKFRFKMFIHLHTYFKNSLEYVKVHFLFKPFIKKIFFLFIYYFIETAIAFVSEKNSNYKVQMTYRL